MLIIGMLPKLSQVHTLGGLALSGACPNEVGTKGPRHIAGAQPGLAHVGSLGDFAGWCLEVPSTGGWLNGRVGWMLSNVTLTDRVEVNLCLIRESS